MEKLKEALKPRVRLMGIAILFFMCTTFVSLVLIFVPSFLSNKILMTNLHFGSAVLGSVMGQVTILFALSFLSFMASRDKGFQEYLRGIENVEPLEN